jgi:hypothetical protein
LTGLLSIQGSAKKIMTEAPIATTPQNLASMTKKPTISAPHRRRHDQLDQPRCGH